jgi:hypothetical protein
MSALTVRDVRGPEATFHPIDAAAGLGWKEDVPRKDRTYPTARPGQTARTGGAP